MKPDWKDAPEWANYLAMDDSGVWCWFSEEPVECGGLWTLPYKSDGEWEYALDELPDSKTTLERRP